MLMNCAAISCFIVRWLKLLSLVSATCHFLSCPLSLSLLSFISCLSRPYSRCLCLGRFLFGMCRLLPQISIETCSSSPAKSTKRATRCFDIRPLTLIYVWEIAHAAGRIIITLSILLPRLTITFSIHHNQRPFALLRQSDSAQGGGGGGGGLQGWGAHNEIGSQQ